MYSIEQYVGYGYSRLPKIPNRRNILFIKRRSKSSCRCSERFNLKIRFYHFSLYDDKYLVYGYYFRVICFEIFSQLGMR